jgi:hypothetical protein
MMRDKSLPYDMMAVVTIALSEMNGSLKEA